MKNHVPENLIKFQEGKGYYNSKKQVSPRPSRSLTKMAYIPAKDGAHLRPRPSRSRAEMKKHKITPYLYIKMQEPPCQRD